MKPVVVQLRPTINEETIEHCRDLLRMAEAGQITSIMAVCETPDGGRHCRYTAGADMFAMLASVARLQHRIQTRLDDATKMEESK